MIETAKSRDDVVPLYADAIQSREWTDWGAINGAIIDRWSRNALSYIKAKAWKLVDKRRQDGLS